MKKSIFFALIFCLLGHSIAQTDIEKVSADDGVPVLESVTPTSPCTLVVRWSCKNAITTVDNFIIYWFSEGEDVGSHTAKNTETSYTIDLLLSNTTYAVVILSNLNDGNEQHSESKTGTTLQGTPSDVGGLQAYETTDSTIPLTWSNTTNKCPIRGFKIAWNGDALWDESKHSFGEKNTSYLYYTISHLMAYSSYDITVSEVTTDGIEGDPATLNNVETKERIAEPPESVNATALDTTNIYVSWETPRSANGIITGYFLSWTGELEDDPSGNMTTSDDTFDATITDLIACVDFNINIHAINGAGYGKPGSALSRTKDEVPPAPTGLNCTVNGSNSVTVEWNELVSENTRCEILGYQMNNTVEVIWNGEQSKDTYEIEYGADLTYTYDNFYPHTDVYISLAARTESYIGVIATCNATTEDDVPGSPVDLEEVAGTLNGTSVTVTWKDPIDKNGLLQNFHVIHSNIRTDEKVVPYSKYSDAFYTCSFDDLNLETMSYNISVYATNEGFDYGDIAEIIVGPFEPEE